MKQMTLFLLFANLVFLTSCLKQTESITPMAEVKTLAEIQRESMMKSGIEATGNVIPSSAATINVEKGPVENLFFLSMKYKIKDLDVYDTTNISNGLESLSNAFVRLLANIFIKISGGKTVNIGVVNIPIGDLNLDFTVIKSVKLNSLSIKYSKQMQNPGDFSFIKYLNINKLNGDNILTYKKAMNQCNFDCLELSAKNDEIIDLVKNNNELSINPVISISKLPPEENLIVDGEVNLKLGLMLPF